jgi:ParB/RepB/Spo0J family partition protein
MALTVNAGDVKRGELLKVFPENIKIARNFGRFDETPSEESLQLMIASIKERGQLAPVRARRLRPSNELELVAGRTRYEAITWINSELPDDKKMRIDVTVFDGNEADAVEVAIAENVDSTPPTPMDRAAMIRNLKQIGKSDAEIAKAMRFKTTASVSQYRGLLSLDQKTQRLVHKGEITFSDALKLLKKPEEERKAIAEKIETALAIETLVPAELRQPAADTSESPSDPLAELIQATEAAQATQAPKSDTPVAPAPPSTPRQRRAAVSNIITGATQSKRNLSQIMEFFDPMVGAPGVDKRLQALAQEMVNLRDGLYDDDKQFERFRLLMANKSFDSTEDAE